MIPFEDHYFTIIIGHMMHEATSIIVGSPNRINGNNRNNNASHSSSPQKQTQSSQQKLLSMFSPSVVSTNNNNIRLGRMQILAIATVSLVLLFSVPSEDRFLRSRSSSFMSQDIDKAAVVATKKSAAVLKESSSFVLRKSKENKIPSSPSSSLKIAWLMSFPNSGTSYTIKLIRHLTLTLTATNYGSENRGLETNESVPVFGNKQPSGPYWSDPSIHPEYDLPTEYVLTKTHCGSRCINCGPYRYVETTFSFRDACLTGHRVVKRENREIKEMVRYPSTLVAKAIHLIRNPFDNVVSRFHLESHPGKSAYNKFPRTRDGFRAFCQRMNAGAVFQEKQAPFLDNDVLQILENVPCRADFIRYVQWHNLAFATSRDLLHDDEEGQEAMPITTYVLHYDWYATRFNETVSDLLEFLHLTKAPDGSPEPFALGKVYSKEYFTSSERDAVKNAFRAMASQTTWKHIEMYFRE